MFKGLHNQTICAGQCQPHPRDLDEELKEISADVLWLYIASYRSIESLPTLFAFFWWESKFKVYLGV